MRAVIFVPVLLLGTVLACATRQASLVPVEEEDEAVYEYPLEEVWPSVKDSFQKSGFRFREDAANFVLETEWREEFAGSRVAGYWHRYAVIGKRDGPSRCRIWIVRNTRQQSESPGADIRQPEWSMGRLPDEVHGDGLPGTGEIRPHEFDVRIPDGRSPLQFVPQEAVSRVSIPVGETGVAGESPHGTRDMAMERKLHRRVLAVLEARQPGSTGPALSATTQEPGVASIECGLSILGLSRRAQRGGVMLLGELHGTREVPRFVAQGTCQVALDGIPVTVGLELPVENQERVQRFMASAGTEEDWARLMESPFWRSPYPDGRNSEAVLGLLEQLRWMRSHGLDVKVFVFDHPSLQGEAREAAMAKTVLAHVEGNPERFSLILTGNIHPRTVPGVPWDLGYRAMGYLIARKLPSLLALDIAFDSGTAWICTVEESLECGVRPAKGKDHGSRYFIHLLEAPNDAGFHGIFYVGKVKASPPAIQQRGAARPGSGMSSARPTSPESVSNTQP